MNLGRYEACASLSNHIISGTREAGEADGHLIGRAFPEGEEAQRAQAFIPPAPKKRGVITPGALVYWLWHYPRLVLREGWKIHLGAWWGRKQLIQAVAKHRPEKTTEESKPAIEVSLMTGRKHAPLTMLALISLGRAAGRTVRPVIHSDGTLSAEDRGRLQTLFPRASFPNPEETREALDRTIPLKTHPFLRRVREGYLNLRKLTDIHAISRGWTVVLDSDVVFYRKPAELLRAADERRWAHMVDCQTSYGCPVSLLDKLAGCPVHPQLNAGLLHINSRDIDWDFLERSTRTILAQAGFSYYLEQALLALLMAQKKGGTFQAEEYLVNPSEFQVKEKRETAHHFVDRSIFHFYRYGWQELIGRKTSESGSE